MKIFKEIREYHKEVVSGLAHLLWSDLTWFGKCTIGLTFIPVVVIALWLVFVIITIVSKVPDKVSNGINDAVSGIFFKG